MKQKYIFFREDPRERNIPELNIELPITISPLRYNSNRNMESFLILASKDN